MPHEHAGYSQLSKAADSHPSQPQTVWVLNAKLSTELWEGADRLGQVRLGRRGRGCRSTARPAVDPAGKQ